MHLTIHGMLHARSPELSNEIEQPLAIGPTSLT